MHTLFHYEVCINEKDLLKREMQLKTAWGKKYINNRIKNYLRKVQLDGLKEASSGIPRDAQ